MVGLWINNSNVDWEYGVHRIRIDSKVYAYAKYAIRPSRNIRGQRDPSRCPGRVQEHRSLTAADGFDSTVRSSDRNGKRAKYLLSRYWCHVHDGDLSGGFGILLFDDYVRGC